MSVHANAARPNAVLTAAFFLPLALIPWLNPFAGGAMTPAIPLLVGWSCTALLFAGLPARRLSLVAGAALAALVAAVLAGLLLGRAWQLLALSLLMIGAAAAVGARLAQDFAGADPVRGVGSAADARPAVQTGVELIAWGWLLAGLLNALIGLLQYRQHTAWLGQWVNHAPAGQVYGNLRQRNQLATLLCMALWALWYLWLQGGLSRAMQWLAGRAPQWLGTLLAWGLMLPLAGVLALTLSRTGLVQLGLSISLLAFWSWHQTRAARLPVSRMQVMSWLAGLAAVYLAVTYVLPHLHGGVDMLARLEGTDSRACISRKVLWGNVLQLIAQKPWWGWGWGELDYAHYHASYSGLRFCSLLDHAHNLPLHLAVELGVPAAVLLCGWVAWWVLRQRPWAEMNPARQLMWGVLALIGLHSLLEYPLWYAHFQQAFGLALGVLWATQPVAVAAGGTVTAARPHAMPVHAARRWQGVLALGLLAGMAYASFDFVRVTQLYMAADDRVWPFRQHTRQQAEHSVLYRNAVQFAAVSTDPVTPEKAEQQLAQARRLMHYSPESRVVIRIIECLQVLGRQAEADAEIAQFQQVYPKEYARWRKGAQP
ncbi:MAG: Wzy polymerase domain-containing protein [Brachymonas sp.]|nr:Wzy polymerase domain-containing protein [Brachymonas sp.]